MSTALWDELVASAALGTARRPPPAPEPGTPVGDLLAGLAELEPERALLLAAGALAVQRRAGRALERAAAPPPEPPALGDEPPLAPPLALARLDDLLAAGRPALLTEALALLVAAGRTPAPEQLPSLLDAATAARALRVPVAALLGARGRWLAARDEAWAWARAALDDPGAVWRTGRRDERLTALAVLRRRDPAAARALVEATFAREPGDVRLGVLAVLADRLEPADEPFLEATLDDGRADVRRAAAGLLARLPGSGLAGRMAARARGVLRREGPGLLLDAAPEPDAAGRRDGLGGDRHGAALQLVGLTPPAVWEQALGVDAATLATAALAGDAALWDSLARAAHAYGDERWRDALAAAALPVDPRRAARLALAGEGPLDARAGRLALAALRRAADQRALPGTQRAQLEELAERLPPALAPEAAEDWPDARSWWASWAYPVGRMLQTLTARRELAELLDG